MIPPIFLFGTIALFVAWCVGMVRLWKGRPALALWSASLSLVLGASTFAAASFFDRYSQLAFGGLGSGDGMGMIGLFIFSAGAAVGSLIALLTAIVVGSLRRARTASRSRNN